MIARKRISPLITATTDSAANLNSTDCIPPIQPGNSIRRRRRAVCYSVEACRFDRPQGVNAVHPVRYERITRMPVRISFLKPPRRFLVSPTVVLTVMAALSIVPLYAQSPPSLDDIPITRDRARSTHRGTRQPRRFSSGRARISLSMTTSSTQALTRFEEFKRRNAPRPSQTRL